MNFSGSITSLGTDYTNNPLKKLGIQLSNIIALILFGLSLVLFVLYYYWYGWNFVTYIIPISSLFPLLALLLNKKGLIDASRVWIGTYVPILVTFVSVYSKHLYYADQQDLDYFTFRFLLLAACVLPPVLFSLRERALLISCYAVCFLLLIGFDPLHNFFLVPFPHKQLQVGTYHFTNIVVLITFCFMTGVVTFLKYLQEKNELKNQTLIQKLNIANKELEEKNEEIEEQAMELMSQSESLSLNQSKLQEANIKIEKQKTLLHRENIQLETELINRNEELTQTNSELIKHNNELRQFSYTISHNLRGPVASLLGLTNLLNEKNLDHSTAEIILHIRKSTEHFDSIIRDLGKIIDIRHDIFKIRQQIALENEVEQVKSILEREIKKSQVQISGNYHTVHIYSVQPMISSILYNLISNGIKYRSQERTPKITINFAHENDQYIITVTDNGLGINLTKHRENLFRLYKRFHQHTEGKGLGLYLVKLQAEALGGTAEVESVSNQYTKFIVTIKVPPNVDEQVLADEPASKIFYDAVANATGVVWKMPASSQEFRAVYRKGVEFMRAYNTPNWITDMRKQGIVDEEDEGWLIEKILPDAYRLGLRRIAGITTSDTDDPKMQNYLTRVKSELENSGVEIAYFNAFTDAREWLLGQNGKLFR